MATEIAIFGGGIGGLSAAHWLTEGLEGAFHVAVYEALPSSGVARSGLGGKARSFRPGVDEPPAEHGFRFFPGYYRFVPQIMSEIPHPAPESPDRVVADHLREAQKTELLRVGLPPIPLKNQWAGVSTLKSELEGLSALGFARGEPAVFAAKLEHIRHMGDRRRYAELEHLSWWDYVAAAGKSSAYKTYLADGMNVRTVAARGWDLSARTVGCTLLRLISDWYRGRGRDRVLEGPTSECWIDPWTSHLRSKGVTFSFDSALRELRCAGGRITGAVVGTTPAHATTVTADHYVVAVPLEVMCGLLSDELLDADPSLAGLHRLETRWMSGVQLYLRRAVPAVPGHRIYVDSPFALTSISQRQFWPGVQLGHLNGERVEDVLSVIVSDWTFRCDEHGLRLDEHSRDDVVTHVWRDVRAHHANAGAEKLRETDLLGWSLDPAITIDGRGRLRNDEPLLINRPGDWEYRPYASTEIENLFLASDYVRTETDLATMEAAAEAACCAALGVLAQQGLSPRGDIASCRPGSPANGRRWIRALRLLRDQGLLSGDGGLLVERVELGDEGAVRDVGVLGVLGVLLGAQSLLGDTGDLLGEEGAPGGGGLLPRVQQLLELGEPPLAPELSARWALDDAEFDLEGPGRREGTR